VVLLVWKSVHGVHGVHAVCTCLPPDDSSFANGFNNNLVVQNNGNTQIRGTLFISGTTTLSKNTTCGSSWNVSGVTTLSNNTIINVTTQLDPKILLSGQEYLVPSTTSTNGIALVLGANRTITRLLFIADCTKLIQNATNPVNSINPKKIRLHING
jgi:hypothetical protein